MGASRQSYKISHRWKWGGKTFMQKIKSILELFKSIIRDKWIRKMFYIDNIKQPFYKHIGCKIFHHQFVQDYDDYNTYTCTKCWRIINRETYLSNIRMEKILKIKSKIT